MECKAKIKRQNERVDFRLLDIICGIWRNQLSIYQAVLTHRELETERHTNNKYPIQSTNIGSFYHRWTTSIREKKAVHIHFRGDCKHGTGKHWILYLNSSAYFYRCVVRCIADSRQSCNSIYFILNHWKHRNAIKIRCCTRSIGLMLIQMIIYRCALFRWCNIVSSRFTHRWTVCSVKTSVIHRKWCD